MRPLVCSESDNMTEDQLFDHYKKAFQANLREAAWKHHLLNQIDQGLTPYYSQNEIRLLAHERDALRDSARRWAVDAGWLA